MRRMSTLNRNRKLPIGCPECKEPLKSVSGLVRMCQPSKRI
jgi:hypothetical protein